MSDYKRLRELALTHIEHGRDGVQDSHWSGCEGTHWRCCVRALLDALEAEQRDARRYRLAREGRYPDFAICRRDPENELCVQFLTSVDADAAIDAAIAEQEERT